MTFWRLWCVMRWHSFNIPDLLTSEKVEILFGDCIGVPMVVYWYFPMLIEYFLFTFCPLYHSILFFRWEIQPWGTDPVINKFITTPVAAPATPPAPGLGTPSSSQCYVASPLTTSPNLPDWPIWRLPLLLPLHVRRILHPRKSAASVRSRRDPTPTPPPSPTTTSPPPEYLLLPPENQLPTSITISFGNSSLVKT